MAPLSKKLEKNLHSNETGPPFDFEISRRHMSRYVFTHAEPSTNEKCWWQFVYLKRSMPSHVCTHDEHESAVRTASSMISHATLRISANLFVIVT